MESFRRTARRSCLIISLLLSLAAPAGAQSLTSHKFSYDARDLSEKPRTVNLAGSFNGWSTVATPMKDADGDGVWEVELKLADGVHYYKFVLNGDQWKNDPKGDKELEVDDGYGGKNSAVLIGPDLRKAPPPKPDQVNMQFVLHDPKQIEDFNVVSNERVRIRVRVQADDVERVLVKPASGQANSEPTELTKLAKIGGFDVFGGLVKFSGAQAAYYFDIVDRNVGYWRGAKPPDGSPWNYRYKPGPESGMYTGLGPSGYALRVPLKSAIDVPDWAKHAVWYQIFPERFRNGDPSNDPGEKDFENLIRWQADWWKIHVDAGEAPGQENFYKGNGNVWKRRFGGDIQGCKEALPYLRSLGVNAIYFNPVFEGDSLHKYDASDYRHIDDNFGVKGDIPIEGETDDPSTWKWSKSDLIFLDFIQEAHRQGFKVIIDGVFNHVGRSHPFFQDVLKNGKSSKYADWFEITDWGSGGEPGQPGGIQWRGWAQDNGALPVFKKDPVRGLAPGPYEHVMAITRRWLAPDGDPSKGVDGWRLDVPGDIPHPFWIEWRKVVKSVKPDAYITGELWDWAQPWLQGDQFDAVMNYHFAKATQDFFVNERKAISPSEFNSRLVQMIYAYPLQVSLVQQNLFDSHDTDRLASMFVNLDLPYDGANRIQDNGPNYKPDPPNDLHWTRLKQAVAFQMMFLGAPMIYYGTEAGMWSPDDPSNRMPMWWKDHEPFDNPSNKFNEDLFRHYQRVIAIRNQFPALRTGFFRPVVIDDERGVYGFVRELGDERVYVVLNRSDRSVKVDVPIDPPHHSGFIDWMNPAHQLVEPRADDSRARPAIMPSTDAPAPLIKDGKATIELAPYGTAVLTAWKH